jgi:23S rRNA (cytidine2498-2'-O)-methyltransferase
MHAFIVNPGFEPALAAELACPPHHPDNHPGVVICHDDGTKGKHRRDPIFARQVLPDATEICAVSAQRLAEAAYVAIASCLDESAVPSFSLHAFAWPPEPSLGSRIALVGQQLLALLKERRRHIFRGYRPGLPASAGEAGQDKLDPHGLLIQLLALDRERVVASAAYPRALPCGGTDLAPWPAGSAPIVADDHTPPSRAYQKLEEAFRWLNTAPTRGQSCVDLGGAPGGWAWTALKRGARVTAVDRAPLVRPAAGHANLTAVIGNAFNFQPSHPVDWLLCDVICEPARTLALIDRWLDQGWCHRMVVSVKFKGRDGYGILDGVTPMFNRAGWRFVRVKQLVHNKNEVTVLARRR